MSETKHVIPQTNDYKATMKFSQPRYRYRDISPDVALAGWQATANTESTFTLPSNVVFNLARSRIEYEEEAKATALRFTIKNLGALHNIKMVEVITEQGVVLCQLSHVPEYTRLTLPVVTDVKEWESSYDASQENPMFCRSNLLGEEKTQGAQVTPAGTATLASSRPYSNVQQIVTTAAVNTALASNVSIPGKMLPHTILSLDRDLFFNEQVTIRITWAPTNTYFSVATTVEAAGGVAAIAGMNHGPRNLKYRLAIQDNQEIASSIKQAVYSQGINLNMPYPIEFVKTTDGNTTYDFTAKLSRAQGKKLLRCYSGLLKSTIDTMSSAINNNRGNLYTTYRTYVNAVSLQDKNVDHTDAYLNNKLVWENSLIRSPTEWEDYAVVIDDFSGMSGPELAKGGEMQDTGASLEEPMDYTVEFPVKDGNAYDFCLFAVCQRTLHLKASGTQVSVV